jgi:hypothetical protein
MNDLAAKKERQKPKKMNVTSTFLWKMYQALTMENIKYELKG